MELKSYDMKTKEKPGYIKLLLLLPFLFLTGKNGELQYENSGITVHELIGYNTYEGIYYEDVNKPSWENKLFLVFKNAAPPSIKKFYNNSSLKYNNYYDSKNGKFHEILAFTIPPYYKTDYLHIINGEYSKIKDNLLWNKMVTLWQKAGFATAMNANEVIYDYLHGLSRHWGTNLTKIGNSGIFNLHEVPLKKEAA